MGNRTIEYYEANAEELASRYESADVSELHSRLLATFRPGSSLLEVGCGTGREAAFLIETGCDVDCIEASRSMISLALEYHPELQGRLINGEVPGCLESISKKYDGIYSIATLMHLEIDDIPVVLERFHSRLKTSGRILISVPLSRPDLEASGYDPKNRYFLLLSEEEWCDAICAAGFTVIETSINADGMGRSSVKWLSCVAVKKF
ncbi:MAG: class I SAM-dependent methyltransferase [Spirochaetota bacterium]|nr:class I SAM-dependent methyltransferase [Spirochaetota bacterium]